MELLVAFAVLRFVAVLFPGRGAPDGPVDRCALPSHRLRPRQGALGVLPLQPDDDIVRELAELALFSVLFTDGMRTGVGDQRTAWRLPGRALILGMPLTFGITALLAHLVAGLPCLESMLVGAVLAPTDPVFASAIVGRPEVPQRLRRLLNVENAD